MEENIISAEELAQRLQDIVARLKAMGRSDLILRSIGGSTLEELNGQIEFLLTECVKQHRKDGKYISKELHVRPQIDLPEKEE